MSVLTKDQIFAVKDLPQKSVKVPEWKGSIIVRAMGGVERDAWDKYTVERQLKAKKENKECLVIDNRDLKAVLLVLTCVDAEGTPMFGMKDVDSLQKKNGEVLDRLSTIAGELSGIRGVDEKVAEKN